MKKEKYNWQLLLLLLSPFSRVRLSATPQMAARQAPLSLGISRQEHWSGLPFPSPMQESGKWKWKVKSESEVAQSCPTLSDPMDCSLPGSSIHGIFQARVLEWGAIAFSNNHHTAYLNSRMYSLWNWKFVLISYISPTLLPFPGNYHSFCIFFWA